MDGILLVDKPPGISSFGVVAKIRSVLSQATGKKIKVGHTGTLDPMATGLLILVIGKYTKQAGEFSKLDKTYAAELTLGAVSSTGDAEGEITEKNQKVPSLAEVEAAVKSFLGEIEQTPPAYSAVKIEGKRAYKLARAGQTPEIKPRRVKVYSITDMTYEYPSLRFTVKVSSGTYIRSLAQDIGQKLGTGAYLSALRRIAVNAYQAKGALGLDDLTASQITQHLKHDLPTGVKSATL